MESYEFLSEGPKGTIKKVIRYQEVEPGLYNLAFGDWDKENQHPDVTLVAMGQTPAKTRLYQMGLSQHWKEVKGLYDVTGYRTNGWEAFTPGRNYDAFGIKTK
jgi:hypothetical protein